MTSPMVSLLGLEPSTYQPSRLHHPSRLFPENNCYVDLWIELLHASGIDPAAAMVSACCVDFEGDQWTFFKPLPDELLSLFGIDVHEMQLYRPVIDHALEQILAGQTITIEVDSFYLPDTAATTYHRSHGKSSIAIEALDPDGQILRYFHGAGYYELSGDDYCGIFRIGRTFSEDVLPPYVELVRFNAGPRLEGDPLRHAARGLLRRALGHKPKRNPWVQFRDRLAQDLDALLAETEDHYHAYAFATVRQCGAAFELARSFVEWLASPGCRHAETAAESLGRQASGAKMLLFKLARRRRFDPAPELEQLVEAWNRAMTALDCLAFGQRGH